MQTCTEAFSSSYPHLVTHHVTQCNKACTKTLGRILDRSNHWFGEITDCLHKVPEQVETRCLAVVWINVIIMNLRGKTENIMVYHRKRFWQKIDLPSGTISESPEVINAQSMFTFTNCCLVLIITSAIAGQNFWGGAQLGGVSEI